MAKSKWRHFSDQEKVAILKRHLLEKTPISDLCDEFDLYPNQFYDWLKKFFENGHLAFAQGRSAGHGRRVEDAKQRRISELEAKLGRKNEVLAELMEEHCQLKKVLGRVETAVDAARYPRPGCGLRERLVAEMRRRLREPAANQTITTPAPWIDFAALRPQVPIGDVLNLLGFTDSSRRGGQVRGACPLHGATTGTARYFSANLERHVFHCFECGRSGNALDLWVAARGQTPYDAGLDLCRRLNLPLPTASSPIGFREEAPVLHALQSTPRSTFAPPLVLNSISRYVRFRLRRDIGKKPFSIFCE